MWAILLGKSEIGAHHPEKKYTNIIFAKFCIVS